MVSVTEPMAATSSSAPICWLSARVLTSMTGVATSSVTARPPSAKTCCAPPPRLIVRRSVLSSSGWAKTPMLSRSNSGWNGSVSARKP
jgi:hypothetical protein